MNVDFGKTASDYGTHRAGFPEEFFTRLASMKIGVAGQSLLDLGTGTGALAREFARRGCAVTGVDVSSQLLQEAQRLSLRDGLSISWREARAEETNIPSASFDVVSAGQCWHWFNRERAAQEVHRLLTPGGALLIAHFDWLSMSQNVVERSIQIASQHRETPPPKNLSVGIRGTYCLWLEEVEAAGFTKIETSSFDVDVPYSRGSWRGRMRASAIGGATMTPSQLVAFDEAMRRFLSSEHPEDFFVPHRVFTLIARKVVR